MIEGSIVAIVTPFKNDEVDEDALSALIEFQIQNGAHGILPCGTTGESPTLSHEEHGRVIELTVKTVNKRVPVMAGTGSNSTREAISLTKHAESVGADAALVVVPYYNKPTQRGLYLHFKEIASSTGLPIFIYNIPGRSGVNMTPETTASLAADFDNIVGIKEASGSLNHASKILSLTGKEFILLSGEDSLNYPLLAIGAKGFVSVTANIAPHDVASLYNAFKDGNVQEATTLHYKLQSLNDVLFIETNPIPVKTALNLMGMVSDEFRLPLCNMEEHNVSKLKSALSEYGLIK